MGPVGRGGGGGAGGAETSSGPFIEAGRGANVGGEEGVAGVMAGFMAGAVLAGVLSLMLETLVARAAFYCRAIFSDHATHIIIVTMVAH